MSYQLKNQMFTPTKSDFYFSINEGKILAIVDEDKGGMSVTNDIENVIRFISEHSHIDPSEYMIVYRDSDRIWDGFDWTAQSFVALGAKTYLDAVEGMGKFTNK